MPVDARWTQALNSIGIKGVDALSASAIEELKKHMEQEKLERMQTVTEKQKYYISLKREEDTKKEEQFMRHQRNWQEKLEVLQNERASKLDEWKARLAIRDKQKAKEREELMAILETQAKP